MINNPELWEELFKICLQGAAGNPHAISGQAVTRAEQMANSAYALISSRRESAAKEMTAYLRGEAK